MDVHQLLAQLFQHRQGHRGVVDKRTTLGGANLSTDDGVLRIVIYIVLRKKRLQIISRQVKVCLDGTSLCPSLNTLRISTLTQQESNSAQDNTLSRTSLTSQHREP